VNKTIELKIFQSNNTFWGEVTLSQYLVIISTLLFFISLFFEILNSYLFIGYVLILIFSLYKSISEFENLNGNIIGKIIICENLIEISILNKTQKIPFSEIEKINFTLNDYCTKTNAVSTSLFRPKLLIGKNNYFEIKMKNDTVIKGRVLIESKIHFIKIYEKFKVLNK
jgi:hypothetical protein